ncbi:glycosyltransferase family 2 protein [Gluconobacter roseus]|uniref:glycosyltransferase family 2 protein n=1 Tax=Gluconobacter roseus TaxID=586239 RepID=UPI0038D253DC
MESFNKKYKYSIICCARWEKDYIGEWLAYYKEVGFNHIYVYCNDDDPTEFFKKISEVDLPQDFLTLKHFPEKGKQYEMYLDALRTARYESEWISFFDIDEFLDLRSFGNISNYMEFHKESVDCVYFNWLNFKTSGFISRPGGSVLRNYTYRDKNINNHVKYICKTKYLTEDRIKKTKFPFHHALTQSVWPDINIVNSIGDDWSSYAESFPSGGDKLLNDSDQSLLLESPHIKHYQLKSAEDVIIRRFRSIEGAFYGQQVYFNQFLERNSDYSTIDKGSVVDNSLKNFAERRKIFYNINLIKEDKKIINAENPSWKGKILLDFSSKRVTLLEHNSKGKFSFYDHLLLVYWDNYPLEIFIKDGETYKSSTMFSN